MKRGFYGDKHEVQLALESTAFPGDQDSGMQDMHQTRNLFITGARRETMDALGSAGHGCVDKKKKRKCFTESLLIGLLSQNRENYLLPQNHAVL